VLKVENLSAGYSGIEVIKGVNFCIGSSEIVLILGPNGTGKSTFLKSLFKLADIYSGKIWFFGKDITQFLTHQIIDFGISYVPQGRPVFSQLTVLENLEMGFWLFSDRFNLGKSLERVFQEFPVLEAKKHLPANSLSGGEQQMLAISRALMQHPKLILLDEPSLGLSPKLSKQIFSKLVKLKQQNLSIILVEQNARGAAEIADRICIFVDGQIGLEGDRELLRDPRVKELYLGGL